MASILVIEDVATVLRSVRAVLESHGHRVTGAQNGTLGLALLENAAFDLVITDIWMPGSSGMEVIRVGRARSPTTRFLAITGGDPKSHNARDMLSGKDFGADGVLQKPFDKQELLSAVSRLLETAAALTRPYILVIDDSVLIRQMLTQVLENSRYEVQCAPDGRQGLQAFRKRQPDLVITDIIMPEMAGIETIVELRKLSRDCPIIAISGSSRFGQVDFLETARQLGATATLTKPLEEEELLRTVASCLASRLPGPPLSPCLPKRIA
jgi:CheY-like chemotaxis protein